jgi:hypothetical protein
LVPDIIQACKDLLKLTEAQDILVRMRAVDVLGSSFYRVPDKEQAWKVLHSLTEDKESIMRWHVVEALGSSFSFIPDKNQAWKVLHRFTEVKESIVRWRAVDILGSSFSLVPDKDRTWKIFQRLTDDPDSYVRCAAYHSLGKASVFKAINAKEDKAFKEELEKAIELFGRSSREANELYNPAKFCLPFYRSFLAVTFLEAGSQEQVTRYLEEAKTAIAGSKSRALLLEAVENLTQALQEAHQASGRQEAQAVLEACRQYCDRAAELLDETEEAAPGASKVLRRGLPIVSKRIKDILGQIEDQAKRFCQTTKDTPLEEFGQRTYRETRDFRAIDNPLQAELKINKLMPLLKSICRVLPKESRDVVCGQLEDMPDQDLLGKVTILENVLSNINTKIDDLKEVEKVGIEIVEKLERVFVERFNSIDHNVFRQKIVASNILTVLNKVEIELKKLIEIEGDLKNLNLSLDDLSISQRQSFENLNQDLVSFVDDVKTVISGLPQTEDTKKLQSDLEELQEPDNWEYLRRFLNVAALLQITQSILLYLAPLLSASR